MRIMSNRAGRIGRALLAFFLLATTVVVAPTSVGAQDNVLHDEAADGEISGDAANPLAVDLAVGANVLSGSVQAGNIDYVTVNVPDGYELSGIDLLSYTGPSVSFIGLQEGTQFTEPPNGTDVANLLGFHLFGGEVGSDILGAIGQGQGTQGFTGSLGAGDYTFWIQETGGEVDYSISLNVAEAPAAPSQVLFSVENLQPADGFFFTPVWAGLHNGDFDLFNSSERASAGLEVLAETGATGDLSAEFAQPGRLDTTIGGGPIAPGATVEGSIDIINPAAYRYVSFASMLIPSNDAFFGNDNPLGYELFDAAGNFNGPIVVDIYGEDIYDSGTEVNNASGAAGFSLGFDGQGQGPSTDDPNGFVGIHPDLLENIVGIQTAAGTTIGSDGSGFLDQDEPIARLTIYVDEPPAAEAVRFEVENLQPADGFFFTPVWAGLHNGDFDLFNSGERASAGLEVLAETGATGDLSAEFAQPGRLDTTIAGGPIAPGATVNGHIGIINPAAYRYVSFASMLIPSNDAFFGNGNPLAYELFDAEGNFNGPIVIDIYGEDIYDSGTEVNNASGAAGFSLGFDGQGQGPSTDDPTGTVGLHPDLLENIVGIQTAAGTTIGSDGSGFLDQDEPIARITIYVGEAPVFCAGHEVTVNLANGEVPTEGDDVIRGTSGDDEIMALGGNDIICGLQGDDTIYGGAGFDLVLAAAGNDTLVGGAGNDTLVGGPGQDTIMGQAGNDRLRGGDGADTIYGQGGGDLIRGGDGNDTIVGGFGNDELFGNLGRDNISGNQGDDILRGGAWIDRMNGGSGFDACTLTDPSGNVEVRTACERGVFGL